MRRVLLDEDIAVRFRHHVVGADVVETVQFRGWKGKKNGELLRLAQNHFDVLVTTDSSLSYQQNISSFNIALVVLRPRTKNLADLRELAQPLSEAL
jgi:hypothetical protein